MVFRHIEQEPSYQNQRGNKMKKNIVVKKEDMVKCGICGEIITEDEFWIKSLELDDIDTLESKEYEIPICEKCWGKKDKDPNKDDIKWYEEQTGKEYDSDSDDAYFISYTATNKQDYFEHLEREREIYIENKERDRQWKFRRAYREELEKLQQGLLKNKIDLECIFEDTEDVLKDLRRQLIDYFYEHKKNVG